MGWHEEAGDEFAGQGLVPAVRVLAFGPAVADSADAARLGVPLGAPLLAVRRQFAVGGEATGTAEHRLPADLASALTERDYEALYPERGYRAAGIDVDRGTLLLTATAATGDEASALGVAAGTPLLVYERTLNLADGRRFEWARAVLRADRARFRADFAVPR
jgi:GntR family transcriptional regulator